MFTQYSCDGLAEEVKQVVISVRDYHVRKYIEEPNHRGYASQEQLKILADRSEYLAKRTLLDGLEQFVHLTTNLHENFVDAQIWMPYVRDAEFRQLERANETLDRIRVDLLAENFSQAERIEYLELPWWKKLALWIKAWNGH